MYKKLIKLTKQYYKCSKQFCDKYDDIYANSLLNRERQNNELLLYEKKITNKAFIKNEKIIYKKIYKSNEYINQYKCRLDKCKIILQKFVLLNLEELLQYSSNKNKLLKYKKIFSNNFTIKDIINLHKDVGKFV